MRIRLLGTAAGGGVPQWNCHCLICREARRPGGRVRRRTQSSVAVSADAKRWFLLNASPDIGAQMESFPALRASKQTRGSAIEGVLLSNADLDHTLGLLLLREGEELRVHATRKARRSLSEGISMGAVLNSFCGVDWVEPPTTDSALLDRGGSRSGLLYQALPLSGRAPRFTAKGRRAAENGNVVGYRITDEKTGRRLLFLPDVGRIDEKVKDWLPECDVVLFDGTFWSENEMQQRGAGKLTASAMGHIPIAGDCGSLEELSQLAVKNKIYIHINNTNPILLEDSPERRAIVEAGCTAGMDGMELVI